MRRLVWKVTVVVLAGLVGALLFHLLGVLSGALYAMSDEAGPFAQVLLQALMFLQLFTSGLVGHERSALLLYAVFGAVPFMLLAALWQFVWKPLRQLHERNYGAYQTRPESVNQQNAESE